MTSSVRLSFERLVHTKCEAMAAHALVVGAREVAAARALDLDHARAEVGELARAERRRDRVFQRDDGDAIQRSHVRLHQKDRGSPSRCSAT